MVVSRVRVLAITHLVVGALLIIFGIFDGVTSVQGDDFMFWSPFGLFGISTGVSVHCRNSAFMRYKVRYIFRLPSRFVFSPPSR